MFHLIDSSGGLNIETSFLGDVEVEVLLVEVEVEVVVMGKLVKFEY
jgi:hypothetical protein